MRVHYLFLWDVGHCGRLKHRMIVRAAEKGGGTLCKLSHKPRLGRCTLTWETFKDTHEHVWFYVNLQVGEISKPKTAQQLA